MGNFPVFFIKLEEKFLHIFSCPFSRQLSIYKIHPVREIQYILRHFKKIMIFQPNILQDQTYDCDRVNYDALSGMCLSVSCNAWA